MRFGIDLGGTKTEALLIDHNGKELSRKRIKTEKNYQGTLDGIKSIVEESGGTMNDIVKINVYLKDLEHFQNVNSVMESYFDEPYPARAAVEVSRLPKDVSIEMDAILYVEK